MSLFKSVFKKISFHYAKKGDILVIANLNRSNHKYKQFTVAKNLYLASISWLIAAALYEASNS